MAKDEAGLIVADRPTVASGGTEMTACYRTLADSGALIIWGCLKDTEF
jgi:hypothetical protein